MGLNEELHLLSRIPDILPGMVYRCQNNRRWTMEYTSRGSKRLTGYLPEELLSDNEIAFGSLILDEDRSRVWDEIQAAIKQNDNFTVTYRIRTKSNELKWVWEQGCQVVSAEQDRSLLEGIIVDITEQKKTQAELHRTAECFRSIVDGSLEGICIHRDWRPLFVNQSLADILGYDSPADILEFDSVFQLIAPHERERLYTYAQARYTGGTAPKRYEFEALRKDGTTVILENLATKVEWKGKAAILATMIDISQRKRAEEEARRYREQLAHADRLNMLGEMAAGIAHEINQPLTAILSRCGAARRRISMPNPDLEKLRITLDAIEQQAQRTGKVVARVRKIARRSTAQPEIIDINSLVKQCIEFAEMDDHLRHICLQLDLNRNLPPVMGDPVQIQQVILNLMRNACEAMEHLPLAERILAFSVIRHDESSVQVSISDKGTGISESTEMKLSQSFFSTKKFGLGMGLSISRTIISASGGRLWFTRNPEQGVTFRFTLPIAPGDGV